MSLLRVVQSSFGEEIEWRVTSDSIKVTISRFWEEGSTKSDTVFVRRISPPQRDWLLASFDATYLSAISPCYERTGGITHGMTYYIGIHKGQQVQATTIYKRKVAFFYQFCQRLNRLLPLPYQIGYTNAYFKQ
ncbi:hypothetical protein [Hymenobacter sp. BT730]|uniref:hypothetical protein n=1 Tax=Hymenobacter sp. BT730 TaxID=3063332 RepID=UPI0026DEFCE3|nr:hypothetical protein [Hymenobacter sp. BT730]